MGRHCDRWKKTVTGRSPSNERPLIFHTLASAAKTKSRTMHLARMLDAMVGFKRCSMNGAQPMGYLWWRDRVDVDGRNTGLTSMPTANGGTLSSLCPEPRPCFASFQSPGTNFGSRLQFQPRVDFARIAIIPAVMDSCRPRPDWKTRYTRRSDIALPIGHLAFADRGFP